VPRVFAGISKASVATSMTRIFGYEFVFMTGAQITMESI
jgi:hypothetical protein